MKRIPFVVADLHFGHQGVCNFTRSDGVTPLRPWNDAQEMDESMILYWNNVITPEDKVYVLGDVCMGRKHLAKMWRLNGNKVLIKGNHDTLRANEYLNYFQDIRACHIIDNCLLTHIPVHPGSKGRFKANIHGHTHSSIVTDHNGHPDPWYIPVSVEHINYTPIQFNKLKLPSTNG